MSDQRANRPARVHPKREKSNEKRKREAAANVEGGRGEERNDGKGPKVQRPRDTDPELPR